jgi:hypothetical protein
MSATPARQPAGVPIGGQFASQSNPECDLDLGGSSLADQRPDQIDTDLFPLWAERWRLASRSVDCSARIAKHESAVSAKESGTLAPRQGRDILSQNVVDSYHRQVADCNEKVDDLNEKIAPLEAEHDRRGGWNRYFLVTNTGGHLHKSMSCSTCFDTTQFCMVADASGSTGEELIEKFATTVCSACFPEAPTMPEYRRGLDAAAEAQAAKDAGNCPAGPYEHDEVNGSYRLYRPWGKCRLCGSGVSITSTGKARKHKKSA